jgi:hypothetical protein
MSTDAVTQTYEEAKSLGAQVVGALLDSNTRLVRLTSVQEIDGVLRGLGFSLVQRQKYGPPDGCQLFYQNRRIFVRFKTRGERPNAPFRANQPHISVALTDGNGTEWQNDMAKFNHQGQIAAKLLTEEDRFKETDFQGNSQKFVVIMGGKYDGEGGEGGDAWAARTHFCFAGDQCDDAGVNGLSLETA